MTSALRRAVIERARLLAAAEPVDSERRNKRRRRRKDEPVKVGFGRPPGALFVRERRRDLPTGPLSPLGHK